jgi:NAD(P)-dependent dehydrogenase (short-subunit alcohol dehydrogenase family)
LDANGKEASRWKFSRRGGFLALEAHKLPHTSLSIAHETHSLSYHFFRAQYFLHCGSSKWVSSLILCRTSLEKYTLSLAVMQECQASEAPAIVHSLHDYRGYYTIARLAEHGAHVYMGARNPTKASAAIASIKELYPKSNITLLEMDHMSLASVVAAAKLFLTKEVALHGLINNAGIMATPFEISKDGHEAQWQTNYLAHWVFTSHLLPLMLATSKSLPAGSVRIVNLTSAGHFMAPSGGINFADTSLPNKANNRYGQSKLANVLHAKAINKLYGPSSASAKAGEGEIWTSAIHPGLVESQLEGRVESGAQRALLKVFHFFGGYMDTDTGAWTSVFCAVSPEMKKEQSGTYFERIAKAGWQSSAAKNMVLAAKLEDWTKDLMEKEGWV